MSITKAQAIALGDEIDAAVKAICEKHGMAKGRTSGRYGDTYKYSVEITEVVVNESGVNMASKEATDFLRAAPYIGWKAEDAQAALGSTFTSGGRTFVLTGYKPRSPKRPVVARSVTDGRTYVFPHSALRLVKGYDASIDYSKGL